MKICELDEEIKNGMDNFIESSFKFIKDHSVVWDLQLNCDLEVTNHALRVYIQDDSIKAHKAIIDRLCTVQNKDGGFGDTRDDKVSKSRSTSFCIQMLLRANRTLKDESIKQSIQRGLDYIVSTQQCDYSWFDPTWHSLDATSTSVGTLLFAINEEYTSKKYADALKRGMEYIISKRDENCLWFYKANGSPVTISAHLLQKCATYYGDSTENTKTIYQLISRQHSSGHWDDENVDHTCDAIRAMMLAASFSDSRELINDVFDASYKAVSWIIRISGRKGVGLGDKPGMLPHVERTCDGIDTMLKFKHYSDNNKKMIEFWR